MSAYTRLLRALEASPEVRPGTAAALIAQHDAVRRAAVLREAAAALEADMERFFAVWTDEPRNSPYALGHKDASDELRRLADTAGQAGKAPVEPLVVRRFDVAMEPAPEDEPLFTIGAVAEDGRPVALVLDPETRAKVGRWLAPTRDEVLREARAVLESRLPLAPASRQAGVDYAIGVLLDMARGESTPSAQCAKCRRPFDPSDTRFDGAAQHHGSPWCRRCVDLCHESTDAFHACLICDPTRYGGEVR